ncbi:MAG: tRNA glutamyl-Q(34) synthetase GluQRS [Verrucomicrobiota bacterium]
MRHPQQDSYRGRIAPTPTGYLHLGHARTFWWAQARCRERGGRLVYRDENLDPDRCKPEYREAAMADLRWFGLSWDEGSDCGGAFAPYTQSERRAHYLYAWRRLRDAGAIYACERSRKDLQNAPLAPHAEDEAAEPLYPPEWRPAEGTGRERSLPEGINWRFRVPDGEVIRFNDARLGEVAYTAGADFGDFVVWRRDDVPAYELAVVVDDAAMQITEVVRGEDLLKSTARQLLLYRALNLTPPTFCHVPLMRDASGRRLAKRHAALSLRELRARGHTPEQLRADFDTEC